jgi:hypothetical protein
MKNNSPAGLSVQISRWVFAQEPLQELLLEFGDDLAGRRQVMLGIEGREMTVIVLRQSVQAGVKSTYAAAVP